MQADFESQIDGMEAVWRVGSMAMGTLGGGEQNLDPHVL